MDISYSLLMEEHARINPLQGLQELAEKIVPSGTKMQEIPKQDEVAEQNQQSMALLQGMMKGVQRKPRMG